MEDNTRDQSQPSVKPHLSDEVDALKEMFAEQLAQLIFESLENLRRRKKREKE